MRACVCAILMLTSSFSFAATEERLSPDVRPETYRIHLQLNPSETAFTATETIALKLRRSTSQIRLHSVGLTIEEVVLQPAKGKPHAVDFAMEREILVIKPK